ncbi:TIGR02391 family protein [Bdellovibrio sp. HCB-110]
MGEKGHADEVSERVDRWHARTKKVINDSISNVEAQNFVEHNNSRIFSSDAEYVLEKIDFYRRKVNVLLEELKTHPETLIDPSILAIDSDDLGENQYLFKILHPEILRVSGQKFFDKHYSDSAESAFKEVNHRIKLFLKFKHGDEKDGVPLMRDVFGGATPKIVVGDLTSESGRNMQEGYGHIFAGSIQAIRNPKAHENIKIDKNRAIHFLFLASLQMYKLDEAKIPQVGS